MYDPILGRFLGVDPIIQLPDNSQSFNGYNYCLNNPLKYTDPSGYEYDKFLRDWERDQREVVYFIVSLTISKQPRSSLLRKS
jgi:hypothetical protein